MRRTWRVLRWTLAIVLAAALGLAGWAYLRLRASLPVLDGEVAVAGMTAPVLIERDALGVPTIRAAQLTDLFRALGYLHAQDRYFQMDLLRRRAAGELSELFGGVALRIDRATRIHRFRALAHEVWERERGGPQGPILSAYVEGVNAGLTGLGGVPFEYQVIGAKPVPWTAEDSILVGYAMALDLQDTTARTAQTRAALREVFGDEIAAFLSPAMSPADAAIDGSLGEPAAIPGPEKFDLRVRSTPGTAAVNPAAHSLVSAGEEMDELRFGSNNFALAGSRTAHGGALLANDMHLGLGVPNIWYRASLALPDRVATGVTLPGVPVLIVGSNGRVAWGFTNSYAGTSESVLVSDDQPQKKFEEKIVVRGSKPALVSYEWAPEGPVLRRDLQGRRIALRWTFNQPAAINLALMNLMFADSTDEAAELAHLSGISPQNILIADTKGKIAWTIAGFLPRRDGNDGFVPPAEIPVITADALWTANNRVVGGDALRVLGDGGYEAPARSAQIRDDLKALTRPAVPADLLAIQLDDRAAFLARWRQLLLEVLTPAACVGLPERAEVRRFVEQWGDHAAIDSVGYRAVRAFRSAVTARVFAPVVQACRQRFPEFRFTRLAYETPLWTLIQARAPNWLPSRYASWDELLLAAADEFPELARQEGKPLAAMTWGARNTVQIQHPFASLLPASVRWILSMTAEPLPGDADMPRVQTPNFGASERMVVAPGRESDSLFHMPGGQSGHPLSPFFRAGHEDWARGRPTPFLPGEARHRLTLR
jgi:penicillin amidase